MKRLMQLFFVGAAVISTSSLSIAGDSAQDSIQESREAAGEATGPQLPPNKIYDPELTRAQGIQHDWLGNALAGAPASAIASGPMATGVRGALGTVPGVVTQIRDNFQQTIDVVEQAWEEYESGVMEGGIDTMGGFGPD